MTKAERAWRNLRGGITQELRPAELLALANAAVRAAFEAGQAHGEAFYRDAPLPSWLPEGER